MKVFAECVCHLSSIFKPPPAESGSSSCKPLTSPFLPSSSAICDSKLDLFRCQGAHWSWSRCKSFSEPLKFRRLEFWELTKEMAKKFRNQSGILQRRLRVCKQQFVGSGLISCCELLSTTISRWYHWHSPSFGVGASDILWNFLQDSARFRVNRLGGGDIPTADVVMFAATVAPEANVSLMSLPPCLRMLDPKTAVPEPKPAVSRIAEPKQHRSIMNCLFWGVVTQALMRFRLHPMTGSSSILMLERLNIHEQT